MERKEIVAIEDVFPHVVFPNEEGYANREKGYELKDIKGDMISMNSLRYQLFKTKGCKCVACGVEGTYFAKERTLKTERYHLNLYGLKNGKEVMLTKGRRIDPNAGKTLENLEPICRLCQGEEQKARGAKV